MPSSSCSHHQSFHPSLRDLLEEPFAQTQAMAQRIFDHPKLPSQPFMIGASFHAIMPATKTQGWSYRATPVFNALPPKNAHQHLTQASQTPSLRDALVDNTLPLVQALATYVPLLRGAASTFTLTWHPDARTQGISAHAKINGCTLRFGYDTTASSHVFFDTLTTRLEPLRACQPASHLYHIATMGYDFTVGAQSPRDAQALTHRCDPLHFPEPRPLDDFHPAPL